jgi:hypothetical protein
MKKFKPKLIKYLNGCDFKHSRNNRIKSFKTKDGVFIGFIKNLPKNTNIEKLNSQLKVTQKAQKSRLDLKFLYSQLQLSKKGAIALKTVLDDYIERFDDESMKLNMKFENEKIEFEENGEFKVGTFDIQISVNGRDDVKLKNLEK